VRRRVAGRDTPTYFFDAHLQMCGAKSAGMEGKEAWVTMVTSDSYVVGAVVLAHSLQSTCTVSRQRPLLCMVTPEVLFMFGSLSLTAPRACTLDSRRVMRHCMTANIFMVQLHQVCAESRKVLCGAGFQLEEVADIAPPQVSDVAAWNQSGYTKLNLWRLTDYSKMVYVDADCLVTQRFAPRLAMSEAPSCCRANKSVEA